MSCPNCDNCDNEEYPQSNFVVEPYCDQCSSDSKCIQKVDAECVIYHRDDDKATKLTCMGIPNKTSVEKILETLDYYVCQLNVAPVPLTIFDTPTVDLTAWGNLKHTLQADVKVSPDAGNIIEVHNNGLYAVATAAEGDTTTADNGLTKTGDNIQLGGPLIKNTDIQILGNQLNILTDNSHFNIANGYYYFDILGGGLSSSLESRSILRPEGIVMQTATKGQGEAGAYYISSGVSSYGGVASISSYYPTTDDIAQSAPGIDADKTSYVKVLNNAGRGNITGYGSRITFYNDSNQSEINLVQKNSSFVMQSNNGDPQVNLVHNPANTAINNSSLLWINPAQFLFSIFKATERNTGNSFYSKGRISADNTTAKIGFKIPDSAVPGNPLDPLDKNVSTFVESSASMNMIFGKENYILGKVRVLDITSAFPVAGGTSACAAFQVDSSTGGFLLPRHTNASRLAIPTPLGGLKVFDTDYAAEMTYDGLRWTGVRYNGTKFQGFNGSTWVDLN